MIIFVKDEDDVLVIPVGLGPNVGNIDAPVYENITLDSSTMEQIVNPESGVDGFSSVTVNPYVLDSKTVDASTASQTIVSDEDGLSSVTVNPVTASIDDNIIPENIKLGVSILGVTGTYGEPVSYIMLTTIEVPVWYGEGEYDYGLAAFQIEGNDSFTVDDNAMKEQGWLGLAGPLTNYQIISTTQLRYKLNDEDWVYLPFESGGKYYFSITVDHRSTLIVNNGHCTQTITLDVSPNPGWEWN